jgi:hypothetical protein
VVPLAEETKAEGAKTIDVEKSGTAAAGNTEKAKANQ